MVEFKNIHKQYGPIKAVEGINLKVNPGELFGLIGPDGAGKTSLFRMLTTLLLPNEGEIIFDGKDVVEHYQFVRENVGYMPGSFSLYQDLTVEENLSFFATLFGASIEENYDLIKDIYHQIEPYKKRRAGALSGGMKQKLALSCALIHKPLVLVLDEPTTGVDAVSRKEFWDMLKKLKESGLTILVSTAYMDEATLCDRVALIQDGRILSVDTPSKIITDFNKPLYEVKGENIHQILSLIRVSDHVLGAQPFGASLHLTLDSEDNLAEIKQLILNARPDAKIELAIPTIEDCFMDLMLEVHE
ncbi:MAG: ABC transporter ATP-binding protein [Bacteroidota bacterium]